MITPALRNFHVSSRSAVFGGIFAKSSGGVAVGPGAIVVVSEDVNSKVDVTQISGFSL